MSGREETICLDCDKKTQKELPEGESTSSTGAPCQELYKAVTACVSRYSGQIGPCTKEWAAFKECHQKEKQGTIR